MKRIVIVRIVIVLIVLAATPAYAQIENCPFFKRQIDDLVAGQPAAAVDILDPGQGARCYALYVAGGDGLTRLSFSDFVKRFESSRSDKQSSAGASASGTTSVVAQGPAAKVLSIATEYGAVTQAVNGQVVTLRGNLAGLPSALVNHDIFPYCVGSEMSNGYCISGSMLSALRRISLGVSFDASRDSQATATPSTAGGTSAVTQPVTFTASRNEISAFSARVELWNGRDTTSKDFLDVWKKKVPDAMNLASTDLLLTAGTFYDDVKMAPGFAGWNAKHLVLIRAAAIGRDRTQIVAALKIALGEFLTLAKTLPNFQDHTDTALASYSKFFLAQDELLDSLNTTVLAFEYANNRPTGQPSTTDLRLVADIPLAAQTKVVLNGAVALYDDPSAIAATGATRVRDAQVAAELDQSLGTSALTGPLVFSIAGYYQYQNSPAVLNVDPLNPVTGVSFVGLPAGAKTVFATTGNIILGQAKLTLTPPGSGVKIPIAVTYSNRTEIIDKPTWRWQVGVTYDVDSLFSALKTRP